jgi:selenocysteine lyase/cysteine desulfurase
LLEELTAYKVRPAPNSLPGKWMTGTQNHEGIAGTMAAVDYLTDLGRKVLSQTAPRRVALDAAYQAIVAYERGLVATLLAGLADLPDVKVWGITDPERFDQRVPTVAITHQRLRAGDLAEYLARRGIFVWHGNFYALPLTEALGLEPDGVVRIGLLHYNTTDEVRRLLSVLAELD